MSWSFLSFCLQYLLLLDTKYLDVELPGHSIQSSQYQGTLTNYSQKALCWFQTRLHTTPSTLRITSSGHCIFSHLCPSASYTVVLPNCWSSLHFGCKFLLYSQPLLNHPLLILLQILLGTLNLFLLLLRVFAMFILILLYKLWWFPNALVIIFEFFFFFLYSYLKHFCYQICDFFGFKFLLQKTSPTPSSIRMQLLCLLVKTYIQMLFVLVLWKIPLVAWYGLHWIYRLLWVV